MAEPIITIESLSKRYRLGRVLPNPYQVARQLVGRFGRRCARVFRSGSAPASTPIPDRQDHILWALRDVNLCLRQGEVLGIIGRNGAGKSTLLKILARITEPTTGRATMYGRVASLLEVGTGFHPELTGRDNIYLNGSILGLTRAEIRRRFDAVVDFAGVERFLDTPVKRYSSGMYVRLAFSVAAHLEPEILIVDEVLAVGDVAFQRKCLGKMQTIADGGRTVLFVSHNMAAINHFCTRAIHLHDGCLVADGDPANVVGRYITESFTPERSRTYPIQPDRRMQIRRLELHGLPEGPGGLLYRTNPLEARVVFDVRETIAGTAITLVLEKPDGNSVCQTRDVDCRPATETTFEPGTYEGRVRFPGDLLNSGSYMLRPLIEWAGGRETIDHQQGITFELQDPDGSTLLNSRGRLRAGVLFLNLPWNTRQLSNTLDQQIEPVQHACV
ncbi:MAG: polysaccharide ABC transporter ATP-binding protein [Planctomycetota bacterium]